MTKNYIIKALCISEHKYAEMVESFAYVWLTRLTSDGEVISEISKSSIFWKWWINQWDIRDEKFAYQCNLKNINEALCGKTLTIARDLFFEAHNPKMLTVIPNKFVINEIKSIVKNEI